MKKRSDVAPGHGHGTGKTVAPTSSARPAAPDVDLRTRPVHEDISRAARELWQRYGCPSGRDEEIWLEAERQLLGVDPSVVRLPGGGVSAPGLRQAGDIENGEETASGPRGKIAAS